MSGPERRDTSCSRGGPEPLYPRLRASKSVPRERVIEDQRARLHGAIAEAVRRHGYENARVNEIVALAGVSTSTLYSIYGGKLGCFLGAYDALVDQTAQRVASAYCGQSEAGGELAGLDASLRQMLGELSQHPAGARLVLAEALAVGDPARSSIDRGEAVFAGILEQGLARQAGGADTPAPLVAGIFHGICSLARRSLLEGRMDELAAARGQLLAWLCSYPHHALGRLAWRHATRPSGAGRPIELSAWDERARILAATSKLAADVGLRRLSLGRIAEEARVSVRRLAETFCSVDACVLAAAEAMSVRALARALQQARGARDWPGAVCTAIDSLYSQAAHDPAFARVCFVEVVLTGSEWAPRRGALLTGFARLLASRAPAGRTPQPITAELIAGGVWGIAHRAARRGEARSLPAAAGFAAYLTLAPVIGAAGAIGAVTAWSEATPSIKPY